MHVSTKMIERITNVFLYTSRGSLFGTRNSTKCPPLGIDVTTHRTMSGSSTTGGRKEMFYLTTHSTHSIYGHMASDILW